MSAITKRIAVLSLVLVILSAPTIASLAETDTQPGITPSEAEFIALAEEFEKKLEDFRKQAEEITGSHEIDQFYKDHDPSIEYLPRFLAFERAHAGEDVALDALSEVISYAARGSDEDSPGFKGRREVLSRMPAYEDRELATMVIVRLNYGPYDSHVVDYLQRVAESPDANPAVRAVARLKFAEQVLSLRAQCAATNDRLQDYAAGMTPEFPEQESLYRKHIESLPRATDLNARADKAIAILESLAASGDSPRQTSYRTIDPTGHLVRIDVEKSKTATPLSAKATGLLLKERHLRLGQPAPELEFTLIDGRRWSLAEHRGQVVVIQFSFTGCGPCEAMYPNLRTMADELGDRLSLVTIMRDETPANAEQAQESGKINWDIACDGMPGKICTEWAVDGFPEVYVIDPQGKIAAVGPRGKQLRWKVERLIAPAK